MAFVATLRRSSLTRVARSISHLIERFEGAAHIQQHSAERFATQCRNFTRTPSVSQQNQIFDRETKTQQRARAAPTMSNDRLLNAVTDDLLDRLLDMQATRKFTKVAVVGGALPNVCRALVSGGIAKERGMEQIICIDSSREVLETAKKEFDNQDGVEGVFVHADEEWLPLPKESVDAVLCSLGLHWYNDLEGVMHQSRFALKADGLFLGCLFGGDTLQELRIACTMAEQEREGGISVRVSPLAHVRDGGNLLSRAGFNLPSIDSATFTLGYPSALELVTHLRRMGESNVVNTRRQFLSRDTALATAAAYQTMFYDEELGGVPATFQVIFLTGWKPDASHRGAAARGSATVSMEELEDLSKKGII